MTAIPTLTPGDLAKHAALGIDAALLARAGVRRVDDLDARELLCVNGKAGDFGGIEYPYVDPHTGSRVTSRVRIDHPPLKADGTPDGKYRCPYGDRRHLYFPPGTAPLLADASVPIVIVESEKAALAITAAARRAGRSILPIACGGCWGWRGVRGKVEDVEGARVDEKGPLPDLALPAWIGRTAAIVFDANTATNASVRMARAALANELTNRGASVRLVDLPAAAGVNGPDDFIGTNGDSVFFALIDQAAPGGPSLIIRKASAVPDEPLEKVFGGRLVRGSFGWLAGPGEGGKGMTLADISARFTTGTPFPGDLGHRSPAAVVICVTEDSQGRVKSRLRAAGADLDRVYFLEGPEVTRGGLIMPSPMMLDDDAGAVVRFAKQIDATAFFLETVVEHFGNRAGTSRRSTNNEADVRSALAPFRAICASAGLFGLGALHPRKSYEGGVDDSISGSAAFRNVPRGAHHIYRDPDDEAPNPMRLLFSSKTNYLAQRPPTLRFRILSWDLEQGAPCTCTIENCRHEGRVLWEEEDALVDPRDAEEIWRQIAVRSKTRNDVSVEDAEKFLHDQLQNGEIRMSPKQIFKLASDEGLSKAAVLRAKNRLKLISVKEGFPAVVVGWKLPETKETPF